jgi:hypothetical protein
MSLSLEAVFNSGGALCASQAGTQLKLAHGENGDVLHVWHGHDRGQHESRPCESRPCVLMQQTPPLSDNATTPSALSCARPRADTSIHAGGVSPRTHSE